ncbi:Acetylglutamate kinase [Vibrio stylophorae]|uniref:Acetylglutamate kinase n=1 Tax=Vibrio stylophorae TaxID=659351 RepID=A0ABM8ZWC7_9VIBR|nr:acetylglutamate kinase [Vibrio stylophorae]CAH0534641.1 Acetylglutamate kinase [Vibrio stylophorae]
MSTPLVMKLGGAVLADTALLSQLFQTIASYRSEGNRPLVLVHGGGYLVDELSAKLGFTTQKRNGLRVTPFEQVPYMAGALAGTANKLLQGEAVRAAVPSIGMSLADGGLCHISQMDPALGAVGDAKAGDGTLLHALLAQNVLPIISCIGLDDQGQLMNVNGDQAAVAVAAAIQADLVFLSDVPGVLDGQGVLQSHLTEEKAQQMIDDGVITDGMIVKVEAAFEAANALGKTIEIASWRDAQKLNALFAGEAIGTQFSPAKTHMMEQISVSATAQ